MVIRLCSITGATIAMARSTDDWSSISVRLLPDIRSDRQSSMMFDMYWMFWFARAIWLSSRVSSSLPNRFCSPIFCTISDRL